ncbi:acyl carrier protein [Streptomyces sp. NPDC101733]|uniref:acyl carrier protein n=1 Tax=unclassified Streptomyces TaxID=2593676 RepID=UPI00380A055D
MTISAPGSVIDVISELLTEILEVPAEGLGPHTPMNDLLLDSLMVVELAMAVQDHFEVKVDENQFRDLTLGEFAEAVAARRTVV